MASASSLLPETQFLCSICLDVFTDMVSTPCGHNYCKPCITHHWDTSDVCQCPQCKKTFNKRPELFVNTFITELAAQSRKSLLQIINHNVHREDANVPCDGDALNPCKLKALMSCLVCQTSYCKTHLEPHQRFEGLKRHKLIDAVQNLEDFICQKHNQPLAHFCKTDNVCLCQFCTESDHKSHRIVSLEEECKERKAELGKTDAEVQQMIQKKREKIQEINHPVELSRKDADREKADGVQVFTALISRFERSQAGLIDGIEEKQQTIEKQAEGFIKELQQEITQLEKRSSKLKQLSQTEDQFHLIKNFSSTNNGWLPTKDWTDINVHPSSYFGRVRTAVAELEKTLGQEMEKKLCDTELNTILPHTVDVTLDPDTAHCKLIVSEDRRQVSHGPVNKHLQENPTIFSESVHVLGKQSFSSGKFYYEVQVAGNTKWRLGVARKSVNKKGETSNGNCWTSKLSPKNGYWTIGLMNGNKYKAGAGSSVLPKVSLTEEVQIVGVFVDYDEGLVSFYDVETRVHMYSYTGCTFTEKLFPFFSPCPGYGGDNAAPLIISPVNSTHSHPQLNQRRISTLSLASTHLPKKEKKKMFFSLSGAGVPKLRPGGWTRPASTFDPFP